MSDLDSTNTATTDDDHSSITASSNFAIPIQSQTASPDYESGFQPLVQTSVRGQTLPPLDPTMHPLSEQSLSMMLNRGNVFTIPLQHQSQARVTITSALGASGSSIFTGSNIPGSTRSNVQIHVAQLPPLVPQPVSSTSATSNSHDDEALTRFKCMLCYEFMNDPVGCPSATCSSRFCYKCLVRAARESSRGVPGAKPKCPTCRVEFSRIVRDAELTKEMLHGPTVACRHEGCPEQQLKLLLVQDHESTCSFEKVKCRYSSFGCTWIGRRGDVSQHEGNDCALEKVKVLVQGLRKMEKDHATRLNILQQQQLATLQMQQVYQQNAQRDLMKSTCNLFDLFHYCHVITCSTQHFLQTKERWQSFFRSNEGHAAVTNFLVLLPTVLTCGMLTLLGFQGLLNFCFDERADAPPSTSMSGMALELLLEDSIIGILSGALMTLLLLANFVDSKSSVTWGQFQVPHLGNPQLMGDILAVTIFTMHVGVLEYYGAAGKSFVVWILLSLSSTIYPAVVLTMSHDASRGLISTPAPTLANCLARSRSLEPVLFGLRFCLVGTYFGIFPTLDAAVLSILAKGVLQHPRLRSALSMKNCFLESLPRSFLLAYLGCKAAIISLNFENWKTDDFSQLVIDGSFLWSLFESWMSFGALLLATLWLNLGLQFGMTVGREIMRRANASSERLEGNAPTPDYQILGLASFGVWIGLLGTLLHVR